MVVERRMGIPWGCQWLLQLHDGRDVTGGIFGLGQLLIMLDHWLLQEGTGKPSSPTQFPPPLIQCFVGPPVDAHSVVCPDWCDYAEFAI